MVAYSGRSSKKTSNIFREPIHECASHPSLRPNRRAKCCSPDLYSLIASLVRCLTSSWRSMNWSNALKESIAYAVTIACFICSTSDLHSLLSRRYTARAPHLNRGGSTRSILFMWHCSHTDSMFSKLLNYW